jgi:hypothetical protein
LFSLALVAVRALGKRWYVAPALYLPATMAAATLYVATSTGRNFPTTLPGINSTEIRALRPSPGEEVIVSSLNGVGAAVYAADSAGTDVKWADFNYLIVWARQFALPPQILTIPSRFGLTKDYLTQAFSLRARLNREAAGNEVILGQEMSQRSTEEPAAYLGHLTSDPWLSSNSGERDGIHSDNYFIFDPIESVKNFLVLIATSLGGPIGMGGSAVSRWPPERDVFRSSNTFYGVGRHLLFEVIRPTPNVRLRLSLTRTLTGGGRTALPESAEVHAASNQRLGFVGSGAANITTSPLQLYERNSRFYFALDFGTLGSYFPSHKTGLLRMFNTDIPLDNRQLVGFARDMAVVTESQYANIKRPTSITSWPAGLLSNPNLEFSGIYEDGWISNQAFVVLGKAKSGDQLQITGQIPGLPRFAASGDELRVLLNGKCIYQRHLKPGNFEVANTFAADSAENRLEFFFDRMDQLPAGDDRPVSAQIFQIAIKGGAPGATAHKRESERQAEQPAPLRPPE